MLAHNELNDRLDDVFGLDSSAAPVPVEPPVTTPRPLPPDLREAAERGGFFETCPKCHGTGSFGRYGTCFACKGRGRKTYKTSPQARATARQKSADKKVRTAEQNWTDFVAAHKEIAEWIVEAAGRFPFAAAMREAVIKWGDLTDRQLEACETCVAKRKAAIAARAERAANAPVVDVSHIERAFATARERAQRPGAMGVWTKPLLLQAGDTALQVSPGSAGSQWEGMLFVKTRDGRKLGHVKGGRFSKRFECTPTEEAAVIEACGDPEKAAIAYGKAWSVCSVCHRTLTNDGSIERGIGPICAERFGW